MRETVIVSAVRTPTGKFLGVLKEFRAPDLGALAVREAVARAAIDPATVDECLMGNVVSAGIGQAPARQAALRGGLPNSVGALTINKVCGSGLKAVMLASQAIATGDIDIAVAGGMESMSNCPYLLFKVREGLRMGDSKVVDSMVHDGLWDAYDDVHMGMTGELVSERYKVSREDQDAYAVDSHRKASKATKDGAFTAEMLPISIPQRKGDPLIVNTDEPIREDTSLESLARLKPAFKKDGTVTAGNAPGLNDGAAALVVMEEQEAKRRGLTPLARITGYATGGGDPKMLFYAPVVAVNKLLQITGKKLDHYDLIEANEAFAVQALADGKELGWDWNRVNVNGGAVALGHPIGASGARVLVTLLYAMQDRGAKTGLATLCLGGGNAVAMAVERAS